MQWGLLGMLPWILGWCLVEALLRWQLQEGSMTSLPQYAAPLVSQAMAASFCPDGNSASIWHKRACTISPGAGNVAAAPQSLLLHSFGHSCIPSVG